MRQVGAEGIVSKRLGSLYRGRESRDWLKTKCRETGVFVITGFQELDERRLEAIFVAEERNGDLAYAGQVRFGFTGKGLWSVLDGIRAGPAVRGVVSFEPILRAHVKFVGRRQRGLIRDGVFLTLLPMGHSPQ